MRRNSGDGSAQIALTWSEWWKTNERVLGELDANVARLGNVVWELGFHDGRQYIAISPVGSTADAERIVAAAPSFRDWDIRLFKPPRTWDLKFTIDEAPTEIDGTRWEVV